MAAITTTTVINFAWKGPNTKNGGSSSGGSAVEVVDISFKGAKSEISVHLPENTHTVAAWKFPFTCREYCETELELEGRRFKPLKKQTSYDSLHLTVEQIRSLTIKAGFFRKGRPFGPMSQDPLTGRFTQQHTVQRIDSGVRLEIPNVLEMGQSYCLEVSADPHLSLSARLVKDAGVKDAPALLDDVLERLQTLEKVQKLDETLQKWMLEAVPTSTETDAVIHPAQPMNPAAAEPNTNPSSESLNELDSSDLAELNQAAAEMDQQLDAEHTQAAKDGDLKKMNEAFQHQLTNKMFMNRLSEASKKND